MNAKQRRQEAREILRLFREMSKTEQEVTLGELMGELRRLEVENDNLREKLREGK